MAQLYPESVSRLIAEFNRLPGIGARSAERLAFHILASPRDEALALANAVREVKTAMRACERCFNVADSEVCHICADPSRDAQTICVVELPRDIIAMEKCGAYRGVYHVLQGRLDPLAAISPDDLRIAELFARLKNSAAKEIILALNPTTAGDATAAYLAETIRQKFPAIPLTALARGLTSGIELETAAISALSAAVRGRAGYESPAKNP